MEPGLEAGELRLAPDEARAAGLPRLRPGGRGRRRREPRAQRHELGAGLHPQLVLEGGAAAVEGLQGPGAFAGGGVAAHQAQPGALVERRLAQQALGGLGGLGERPARLLLARQAREQAREEVGEARPLVEQPGVEGARQQRPGVQLGGALPVGGVPRGRQPLELEGVDHRGGVGAPGQGAVAHLHVRAQVGQAPRQRVQELAQAAARPRLGRVGPELERQRGAVQRPAPVERQPPQQGSQPRRVELGQLGGAVAHAELPEQVDPQTLLHPRSLVAADPRRRALRRAGLPRDPTSDTSIMRRRAGSVQARTRPRRARTPRLQPGPMHDPLEWGKISPGPVRAVPHVVDVAQ